MDEDVNNNGASEEEDVPKESLKRAATNSLTVADVMKEGEEELVYVSKDELKRLQELAASYIKSVGESSEPSVTKKQKTSKK